MAFKQVIFLILCASSFLCQAEKVLIGDDQSLQLLGEKQFYWFEDHGESLTLDSILKPEYQQSFQLNDQYYRSVSSAKPHWVKIQILNNSNPSLKWVLQTAIHNEKITLYTQDESGNYTAIQTGQALPFHSRPYYNRTIVFDLPALRSIPYNIYAKVEGKAHVGLIFMIREQKEFTSSVASDNLTHGLFLGFILLIGVYNLILFFSTRSRIYLLFVFYVLSCAFYLSHKSGLAFEYLWPNHPTFNNYHVQISFYVWFICAMLYAFEFFSLWTASKLIKRIALGLVILVSLQFLFNLSGIPSLTRYADFYYLGFGTIYFYAWRTLLKGNKFAAYFVSGFSFIVISLVIIKLREFGVLQWSIYTEYSMNASMVIEVIMFSLAIGSKIKSIDKERGKAQEDLIIQLQETEKYKNELLAAADKNRVLQQKVNQELEEKVQERTTELREANEQLAYAKQELEKMNIALDLDNYKLKKKVDLVRESQMRKKIMSFEEFKEIFLSDSVCFNTIESLKWKDEFDCRKCGNHKFHQGNKKRSRKCSKCGFTETLTAGTIFHGLRFDIQKAMYLTYRFYYDRNKTISVSSLSEELDLRRNTCTGFQKKVHARLDLLDAQGRKTKTWEELICD